MPAPAKILFVTPEIYPLVKTGGLADISGALPLALRKLGLDVRVLVPGYPPILSQLPNARPLADVSALAGESGRARVLDATMPGSDLPLLVLDCPLLFARAGGPYLSPEGHDWEDNVLRFGLLGRVGALLSSAKSPLEWKPDIVHCNDWQSGLIPAILHYSAQPHAKTVMSIHAVDGIGGSGVGGAARPPRCRLCHRRRGVLRAFLLPQGRIEFCRSDHHGKPHLRRGNPDPRVWLRNGRVAAMAAQRAARHR